MKIPKIFELPPPRQRSPTFPITSDPFRDPPGTHGRAQLTDLRGPLGFGPIQFLTEKNPKRLEFLKASWDWNTYLPTADFINFRRHVNVGKYSKKNINGAILGNV